MKHCNVISISLAGLVLLLGATLWAEDNQTAPSDSPGSNVKASRRELWRSSIQTPDQDDQSAKGLQDAIARLQHSMNGTTPQAVTAPAPASTTRPATTQPRSKTPVIAFATSRPSTMTSETKEKILKLNGVTDPGALADVLFQAQHPDLAVVFYGRAIKGATTPETKAWLLFQTANCSNETDPKAAVKTYDQLVASHPKSLWSNIAKLQKGMVQWRTTNNMMLLLNDIEQQGQPASNVSEQK